MDQKTQSLPNDSVGPRSLAVTTPILATGILFYTIRIYTRVVPKYKLNASDWASTIAVVSGIITYALFAAAVGFGLGKHNIYVSQSSNIRLLQCLFGVILTGLWASAFSRVSVAFLLLDFAPSRTWKFVLWFLIFFQLIAFLASELVELFQCIPVRAFWELVPGEKCNAPSVMWTLGYVYTGIGMLGDLTFAIMPMFLIWRLSRSVVERCLISFLMAMGLFATGAGVMKIIYAYTYDRTSEDALREMMPEFLWCRVEEVVLIVASSAPLLKSPVGHALKKMGFPSFQEKTRDLNSFHSSDFEVSGEPQVGVTQNAALDSPRMREHDEEKGNVVGNDSAASALTIGGRDGL